MTPESPKAVFEATRWSLDLDTSGVTAPALVFGADRDLLVPEELVRSLASSLGARYRRLPDQGHGVPLNPVWESVAAEIDDWLAGLAAHPRSGKPRSSFRCARDGRDESSMIIRL